MTKPLLQCRQQFPLCGAVSTLSFTTVPLFSLRAETCVHLSPCLFLRLNLSHMIYALPILIFLVAGKAICLPRQQIHARDIHRDVSLCTSFLAETLLQRSGFLAVSQHGQNSGLADVLMAKLNSLLLWSLMAIDSYGSDNSTLEHQELLPHSYIVLIRHEEVLEDLRNQLSRLQSLPSWNMDARFILILQNSKCYLDELVSELWKYKAADVLVLCDMDLFSRKKYHRCELPPESIWVNRWLPEFGRFQMPVNSSVLYEEPSDLQACIIHVLTIHWPPYVMVNNISVGEINSTGRFEHSDPFYSDGLDVKVLRAAADALNFRILYVWPGQLPWLTMIDYVAEGKVNIAMGNLFASDTFANRVHFTTSYVQDESTWYVPSERRIPSWQSLIRTFTLETWILVCVSYISVSVLNVLITTTRRGRGSEHAAYTDTVSAFLSTYCVLIGISLSRKPKLPLLRSIYSFWTLMCLVVNSSYQSSYISFLSDPPNLPSIRTLDEILDKGLPYGFIPEWEIALALYDDIRYQKVTRNHENCTPYEDCLRRVAYEGNFAVLGTKANTDYLIGAKYNRFGKPLVKPVRDVSYKHDICMYVSQTSLFIKGLNRVITSLIEAGIVSFWRSQITRLVTIQNVNEINDEDGRSFSIFALQGAFFLYAVGNSLAFIVLLIETITGTKMKRRLFSQHI